mgnify:FL=1
MSARAPETRRQIVIGGESISYRLRRSQRRTIGLTIDRDGLRVAAPSRATLTDIDTLIRQHADWVLTKLAAWRARSLTQAAQLADGQSIFILGRPLPLRIAPAQRAKGLLLADEIHLSVPSTVNAADVLKTLLREQARPLFAERLALHAPRLGVLPPPLRLSSAKTRWGSCSAAGNIALNWRLILMPMPVIDYVVCHELAHLKEMNHSPRFWSVVEQLCPDWRQQRLELRRLGRELPVF